MKSLCITLLACAALAGTRAEAEDVDTTRRADTVGMTLSPYSFGLGAGTFSPLNPELRDESDMFLKLTFTQTVSLDNWNVGLDVNWLLPGQNWGGDIFVDYLLDDRAIKPFVGAGAGFHAFDKRGDDFGQGLGPSATVHAGLLLDVLEELQLRVRVPFHLVANRAGDRGLGLDIAILFSSHLRKTRVRKLIY
jgi:hypothetical protein